ncbi:hypothetical protein D3C75_908610 [compost metagenome]
MSNLSCDDIPLLRASGILQLAAVTEIVDTKQCLVWASLKLEGQRDWFCECGNRYSRTVFADNLELELIDIRCRFYNRLLITQTS